MRRKLISLIVVVLLVAYSPLHAADRPGVAAIASAHPTATAAGHEILEQGGNAFDAAVAVGATLGVVEAFSGGMGGGGFWLLHRAEDGMQVMVDHREVAPAAATRDMYLDEQGRPIPRASRDGPLAAGIPGLPAGLVHVAGKYGRLPLAQSLQPAIRAARHGTRVYNRMRQGLEYKKQVLGRWPAARDIFLPGGKVPEIGHVIYQSDLADSMEALAEHGLDGFYAGGVARRMVAEVRAEGGIWTEQDLADYRVVERPPVVFDYRGATIIAAAPPSAGGIALANMFNILSGYRLDQFDRVGQVHLAVEAMRRAYRDRAEYLGDPDFVDIPVERLTHPLYAAGQRTSIRMDRATPSNLLPGYLPKEGGADTTHFSIIDADGNRVAGTQSINSWFGSGFMVPGTGVQQRDGRLRHQARRRKPVPARRRRRELRGAGQADAVEHDAHLRGVRSGRPDPRHPRRQPHHQHGAPGDPGVAGRCGRGRDRSPATLPSPVPARQDLPRGEGLRRRRTARAGGEGPHAAAVQPTLRQHAGRLLGVRIRRGEGCFGSA
jgi:gamma-glutamyltranspeptidase/glutathione hydrolase